MQLKYFVKFIASKIITLRWYTFLKKFFRADKKDFFSQYGEDAFLFSYFTGKYWETLQGSLPKNGFYIDIGAYSPTECSNTYLFYANGWRGINIDATPGVSKLFDFVRPRDTNINVAIGNKEKEIAFYTWGTPCVYNTANLELAKEREKILNKPAQKIKVPCKRLDNLLDKYLENNTKIDFMSIDVEGFDLDVLQSNNWSKFRPEILLVEAYERDIIKLLATSIYELLTKENYSMIGWLYPSVIFKDNTI